MNHPSYLKRLLDFDPTQSQWINKSHYFLLPVVELDYNILKSLGFINCFLNEWNNPTNLELLFKPNENTSESEILNLLELENRKDVFIYEWNTDYLVLSIKLSEKIIKNIINPFKKGQYSKIDKAYVNKKFPKQVRTISGEILESNNYQILNLSTSYKERLEDKLKVYIQNNELLTSPMSCQEVLGQSYSIKEEDITLSNKLEELEQYLKTFKK